MLKFKKIVKIFIICYFILALFVIPIFSIDNLFNLQENSVTSTPINSNAIDTINVTRPDILFDNDTMILNITDIFASINSVYFNGSAGARANISNFSIYLDMDNSFTGITGKLNDTDIDGRWNSTINLSNYSILPGIYYITCYFENNTGLDNGTSPESERFAILGKYNITTASLSYNQATQQLNITDITIRNDTMVLNNSAVSKAQWFLFYNTTGSNTSITGFLNYDNNTMKWNSTNIDVSNLSEGVYFIISFFTKNSQDSVSDLNRQILQTFTIIHDITITSVYSNYTGGITQEVSIGLSANTSYKGGNSGRPMTSDEANVSYNIIFINGSATPISGTLIWNQYSWNRIISVSILSEGDYNITLTISHISEIYSSMATQNTSSFEIIHIIHLTIPQPIFNRGPATLDIIGITAYCSFSELGYLNNSQVDLHYYQIYNSTNDYIGITNNLSYNSVDKYWESNGIILENFTEGLYYIWVFINNTIVPEGKQMNSTTFEIIHKINFQTFNNSYLNGFQQLLNITKVSASSSYYPFSLLQGYNAFRTHNYSFYNRTSRTPSNPPLTGMLEWNGSFWNAININVSKLPEGEYYVVLNFADNISVNSYGNSFNNNFTVSHVMNISVPIINYTNNFIQLLNITNITCHTSYYPYSYLNSTTALNHTYYIFNDTVEMAGELVWNDPYWEAINIDVSALKYGTYKVRCRFSSSETGSLFSDNSSSFQITHVFNVTTPLISFDSNSNLLNVYGIQVYSSNKSYINYSAIIYKYQIFNENNISTGINGDLTWNITTQRWEALQIDVGSLNVGSYYIKVNFSVYQITGVETSNASDMFDIIEPEAPPLDLWWIFPLVILALILPFIAAFLINIIKKKEETI